jgi:hypothetical protein
MRERDLYKLREQREPSHRAKYLTLKDFVEVHGILKTRNNPKANAFLEEMFEKGGITVGDLEMWQEKHNNFLKRKIYLKNVGLA